MERQAFDEIFEIAIKNEIKEIKDNNSLIESNDLEKCKEAIFNDYNALRNQMKRNVFKGVDSQVLDRHRVAACMCGAFLKNDIFDIHKMTEEMKNTGVAFEAGFQYVNELISFFAGYKVLSLFMLHDFKDDKAFCEKIQRDFPVFPSTRLVKTDFMSVLCYNLSQIKDVGQIGINHYDAYAYAMIYFGIEEFFYRIAKK